MSGKSLTECPSNLKEAIDWILRVTGKDGQTPNKDGTAALSKQVTQLLESVHGSGSGLGLEFTEVKDALADGSSSGLIAKLADGLQQFIGYDSRGKFTGGGILPANVAKHQVCNAILNFVIRFLEGLCDIKELKDKPDKQKVLDVIVKLRKCVGTGQVPEGFEDLVGKIEEKVKERFDSKVNHSDRGQTGKLNAVFSALKDIVTEKFQTEHHTHDVKNDTQKVSDYIDAVELKEDSNRAFTNLCNTVSGLFGQIRNDGLSNTAALQTHNLSISAVNPDSINSGINSINKNSQFKNYANAAVFTAVRDAATAFVAEVKEPGKYTSYYDRSENTEVNNVQCAKIFLGCLPLYYQALTYIYWGCHDKGGPWRNLTLGGGALRSYFDSQGLLPTFVDTNKRGAHIAESALNKFTELQQGMTKATSSSSFPYASFAAELRKKVGQNSGQLADSCPLSALFYGASCYFRCQQFKNAKLAGGTPKTIREMLYFLAALQFSPQYGAFDGYVTEYFRAIVPDSTKSTPDAREDHELKLQVADSGITSKPSSTSSSDTLSAADLKSYLTSTFHLAPAFIGVMQGPGASEKSEPWLHSLFSNSQLNLSIPLSGPGILGALSNYAYALQFQLHFLYQQCNNTYTKACGWNQCTFGQKINQSSKDKVVPSHICVIGCTKNSGSHDHNSEPDECEHNGCGTKNKPSPLQAFLTDKLRGFSRGHPSDSSSHLATCSGSLCHVPMGFQATHLRSASSGSAQGENICLTLRAFCGGFNTPLRQLSEKLGCLTMRTPRTLGDLFGFTWHLNGQLFKGGKSAEDSLKEFFSSIGLTKSSWTEISKLDPATFRGKVQEKITRLSSSPASKGIDKALSLFPGLPFWYNIFMVKPDDSLPVRLFKIKNIPHQTSKTPKYNGEHDDLYSLYYPQCTGPNCGPYLYPLTHSDGATYAPRNASTYLSWILYLSDDLQSWLQDMLDEFKDIGCKKVGCKGCNCESGQHGIPNTCSCPSVVQCGGTLPLLYRHGFRYYSPLELMGGSNGSNTKRQCHQFAQQLQKVISSEAPLDNLITTIDTFLYAIRWEFFSKLSGFWTIYVCIILYTFFFLLDTLRVRSHLHFPSSNSITPISLLGTGKAPALRTYTKLTYFMP
ncbi:variant erythrocyte surface antigen-1 family protein [Babesia caballi]|uniref:Variant erythrocyte surface antigen-1 family protein n=1 Tax=Babesia caballi TaxID=5871 RepID=A0AAV4LLT3_BABCB|nr:variant erythrocyte surface antigen-1 family protein [Babesia caballi]